VLARPGYDRLSSASTLNRATNTRCLTGIEMFISATSPRGIVGLPTRLMTGVASSPLSKTVKTGWVFRQREKFVGTRIVVLCDAR
jgi:hypothetical protein